jgi:LPXTG-motif cell wall-anchored protein
MKVRNVTGYSLAWAAVARVARTLPRTGLGDTVLIIVGVVLVAVAAGIAWVARSR